MKFTIIFLVHIFTFVSLTSAMNGSPEDTLKAHHIAMKRALEPELGQYPQHIRDTCHHLVYTLIPLEMGEADCRRLIVEDILNERRVSMTGGELHINISERHAEICESATIIAENAADLFPPSFTLDEHIRARLSLLEKSPASLRFGFAVAREYIVDEMNSEEKAEILSYVPRPDFSYMQMIHERGPTLRKCKNNLLRGLDHLGNYHFFFLISTLDKPCIEALSTHATAFFYNYEMDAFDRKGIVTILGKKYLKGALTAEEIDFLGKITLPLVSDGDVLQADLPSRLRDIIKVVLRGE